MENAEFQQFLDALHHGDPQAAAQLVHDYGPAIARLIRARLQQGNLRHIADSADICQSILFTFTQHATAGQCHPGTSAELAKLLRTMALNKLHDLARKEFAARRDHRRVVGGSQGHDELGRTMDGGSSPSKHVEMTDLLERFRAALAGWARPIHEWRAQGWTWDEIGRELGQPPHAIRVRFARETQRVAGLLGLEEER
jgi:DNA-directed RNA polymerase specialized sigma24 family protein